MGPRTAIQCTLLSLAGVACHCAGTEANTPPVPGGPVIDLPAFTVTPYALLDAMSDFSGMAQLIDYETLAGSAARNLAELLESQAGVVIRNATGNPAGGQVDLRGFGENSGLRTLILVDGMPMNRPDMGTPSWMEIPIGQIERVEVLRGGHTARFGSHAIGGVINIITRVGSLGDQPESTISAETGSWNSRRSQLSHHRGPDHSIALSAMMEGQRSDGWRDNSGYRNLAAQLNLGGKWRETLTWRGGIRYLEEDTELPGPLTTSRMRENPRQSLYQVYDQGHDYQSSGRLLAWHGFGSWRGTDHQAAEMQVALSQRDLKSNLGPGAHSDIRMRAVKWRPEYRHPTRLGEWIAGLEAQADDLRLDHYLDRARSQPRADGQLRRRVVAGFIQRDQEFTNHWAGMIAIRAEEIALRGSALDRLRPHDPLVNFEESWSDAGWALDADLRWQPGNSGMVWWRFNRGYRFPVTDEIAAYQGFPMAEPFNTGLGPETALNLESGFLWETATLTTRVNFFAMWFDGEIQYDHTENRNRNLGATQRHGVEAGIQYEGTLGSWSAFYHFVDARFRDGLHKDNRLPLVARHRVNIVYRLKPNDRWAWQNEWVWSDRAPEGNDDANTRPPIPAWHVFNTMLSRSIGRFGEIHLRVNNLFDRRYASLKFGGLWYPGDGREIRVGTRWTF